MRRCLCRRAGRPCGWLHPLFDRRAGRRDGRAPFRRSGGSAPDHGRRGGARLGVALRAFARRPIVSASLGDPPALGRAWGQAAAARRRRKAYVPGACMIALFDHLARPLLRKLDPETAHGLALNALKVAPLPRPAADDEKLRVEAFGLTFPNPIGLAAGFDKHAEVIDPLLRLGFGFVEAGGGTPKPPPGKPRPRPFPAAPRA